MNLGSGLQSLAFFGFLALVVWLVNRKGEREAVNRQEIYRRLLDAPGGNIDAIRELMRQDDERAEQRAIDSARSGGMVMAAVGLGLGLFLYGIEQDEPVYLVGLIPLLVGGVSLINAFILSKRRAPRSRPN